jgi:hypothetical protein
LITYRVRLDVPRELVWFVAGLLAARRREMGTRKNRRCLGCYRQALFVLAWFRDKPDIPRLGAGFGLSQATSYRYVAEGRDVVAARAPGLDEALQRAVAEGTPYVILDGIIIPADRCRAKTTSRAGKEVDLWYSGKKHDFGGNAQALTYPDGIPIWVSDVVPGNAHDLAAARDMVLPVLGKYTPDMPALADSAYEGAGHGVVSLTRKPQGAEPDINARTRNMLLSSLRCRGERGFALLTQRWKTLQHVTASPSQMTAILQAALVLTLFEHKRLT